MNATPEQVQFEGLGVSRPTVQLWRKRVHEQGIGRSGRSLPVAGAKRTMIKASETGSLKRPCRASPRRVKRVTTLATRGLRPTPAPDQMIC